MYMENFDCRFKHTRTFQVNDALCLNKLLTINHRKEDTISAPDPLEKLSSKKCGPHRVVRSVPHTLTLDVDRLHNLVVADRDTLAKATNEDRKDQKDMSDRTSPVAEPTTLHDRQDNVSGSEEKNVEQRKSSEDMRQQENGALENVNGEDGRDTFDNSRSQVDSIEYVFDGILDRRDDTRRTLY